MYSTIKYMLLGGAGNDYFFKTHFPQMLEGLHSLGDMIKSRTTFWGYTFIVTGKVEINEEERNCIWHDLDFPPSSSCFPCQLVCIQVTCKGGYSDLKTGFEITYPAKVTSSWRSGASALTHLNLRA